ncbi:MAG: hypothetical protein JW854_04515 [Actinobacteria bacterium]|nr:hypothetical protein [Actinomycetota bacterium]
MQGRSTVWLLFAITISLLLLIVGCGDKIGTESGESITADVVIERCKEAMDKVESAHVESKHYFKYEDQDLHDVFREADYYEELPDKTHIVYREKYDTEYTEEWLLGETRYIKYANGDIAEERLATPNEVMFKEIYVFNSPEAIEEPEMLADETVDGIECAVITTAILPLDPEGEYRITFYIGKEDYRIVKGVREIFYSAEITGKDSDYWEIKESRYLDYDKKHDFTPPEP